jgi:hypothetical protein
MFDKFRAQNRRRTTLRRWMNNLSLVVVATALNVENCRPYAERPEPVVVQVEGRYFLNINPTEKYKDQEEVGVGSFVVAWYNNRKSMGRKSSIATRFFNAVTTADINTVPENEKPRLLEAIADCVEEGNDSKALTNYDRDQLNDPAYNVLEIGKSFSCDVTELYTSE